jgi:pimeloyl-ACP methyl ester carboxylesterase
MRARGLIVLAATLASASCSREPGPAPQSQTARADAIPCDARFPSDARCSTLEVVENRKLAQGRRIQLRVVVLPALDAIAEKDPVFFLAGGPGQGASGLVNDRSDAQHMLRRVRDLVFADQRGTGASHPLNCRFYGPPDNAQSYFDAFLPLAKVKECRAELEKDTDLAQYTTAASVEDLDEIRAALGYDRINLIGGSYGTRLAMEYVRKHEDRVRAVILEGPVPPGARPPEHFGQLAQRALDGLLDECVTSTACAAFPDIKNEARAVFDRLRAGPVTATVTHPGHGEPARVTLTRDHVAEAIRYMTYTSRNAAAVPRDLHRAFTGDYSPLAQFLLQWRADGTFDGLYLSITCAEDVPFIAPDSAERDEPTYLGSYRVREQRAACAEWPRGEVPDWHGKPVVASVPVLILSGTLDPVTPPANGDEIARTLSNSLHIRVPHGGHSPAGLAGTDCLSALKRDFIHRARTDGLDTGCVGRIARPGSM